jgi:hypothetical protein
MSDNINTKSEIVKTDDRKALVEIIRTSHQAVRNAAHNIVREAITAGTAILKLKELVKHGEWRHYLERHCELGDRTARVYMQLAEHRELIEANWQHAANLSLRGALKLIPSKSGKPTKSTKATTELSSLAWSKATVEERCRFVDAIGFISWLAAIPPSWLPELERRIDGQRARWAPNAKVDATLSKALRHALSLQKTAKDKDSTSTSIAAALNGIINKLHATGFDLNDVEVVIWTPAIKGERAA